MSNASLVASVTTPVEYAAKITSNSVTTVFDGAQGIVTILRFEVNENAGSTPNLTVEIYDGTNSIYLGSGGSTWVAKAVTAKQSIDFDKGYVIDQHSKLRITSSDAAGKFDVYALYIIGRRTS